ncbi:MULTISPECIES: YitT family protein [Neobacillus]|uniref:YitT family protein n=1 Tax=Neobacillus rhizophilus TaxID=2833579 RepID=A0A942YWH1_9BACI|nr:MULTISPECIES: YitT family protein [Neobacillus]MBS4216118.1 YitT family protein [Neobacillus rhizophilus]MBU8919889.1 YitT family protein [Bacillus sp. FJAT-29953]
MTGIQDLNLKEQQETLAAELEKIHHRKLTKKKILQRILLITLGATLMGVGLEIFLVPNNVIDGGITGISIMLSYLTGWNLGIFLFILNIPFFFIGYKQIGKTFALSTLYGIIILSIATTLFHPVPAFTQDILLATIFGGVVLGIGVGIVIRYGGSLDGTEILAILFNNKLPFSVGEIIMFFNLFILGSAGFVFTWDRAMYSLIAYFVAYKTIDITITGLDESKSVWIISDNARQIGDAILHRLGRGVTYLNGEGAFSGDDKKVIFCVINRLEEAKLKEIVTDYDDHAFLAVADIAEVRGGRFKKRDIH